MSDLRYRLLGCGSSGGVPRIGGHWGACDPEHPRNRRQRCSLLIERVGAQGTTSVLIDTSPDMRAQLIDAGTARLDGVVWTHGHADHTHGLDDLRQIVFNMRARLPVWADAPTKADLTQRFGYAFVQPEGSSYPPILEMNDIAGAFDIHGPGGAIRFEPFEVEHGTIAALGFRIGGLAYLPDVSNIPAPVWEQLEDLDIWVLDALRREPHPSHTHLARSLEWIAKVKPRQAVLTNMHIDLDYETLCAETPANVHPGFDGMILPDDL